MKIGKLDVARPCYNKYWRCSGWAGPGWTSKKGHNKCNSGSLARVVDWDGHWKWKFHKCPSCGRWIAPYVIRYVDPTNLWYKLKWKLGDLKEWYVRHYNKGD